MMTDIREYWDKKIIEWERSAYQGKTTGLTLVEKMASKFRRSIRERMQISLDLLRPFVAKSAILDLGCGSGIFCFKLLRLGALRVIGIDFSSNAIRIAKERALELGVASKCEFIVGDVRKVDLPRADITVGLGLLDYLNKKEILLLFKKLNSPFFLFTFPERTYNCIAIIHRLYLKTQRCPSAYQYKLKEIKKILELAGYDDFKFVKDKRMFHGVIVHNLPYVSGHREHD
jgi:2-polyprenyl-3-methyl-5-hydroxy-6-metoxy-1,4-benzoquinol methylase